LAVAVSLVLVRCVFGRYAWGEVALGWSVAALNAVGAFAINRRSVGGGDQKMPLKGIFFNVLRVSALLGIIFSIFERLGKANFYPFLVALFVGYFIFLIGEIARLHKSIVKGSSTHE
jgi:prepilin signal peptidase PulO-like enzyme (type II secretory pathway)